ncbi:unnamed protein product [Sphagnum compactum]
MSSLFVELESGLGSSGVLTRSRVTVSPKKPLDAIISDLSDAAALRRRTTSPCREVAAAEMRSPPFLGRSVKRTLGREEGDIATGGERQCPPSSRWNSQARILKYMTELFPGRTSEIGELLSILGEACDCIPPLLLYGAAATGKTSIVCEIMRVLGRPHAYASCHSCHNPRLLFESILNQLVGHIRSAANNYASVRRCERLPDFIEHLPGACAEAMSCQNSVKKQGISSSKKLQAEKPKEMVYLVIDNVELMRDWSGGMMLLAALFKLSELTRLPYLGLLFISRVGPDGIQACVTSREPLPLYFRDYNDSELAQILLLQQPNAELYASFLSAVLKTFSRACRRVTELSRSLEPLFQIYCEPILRGAAVGPDDQGKRQRYGLLQPHIRPALSQTLIIGGSTPDEQGSAGRRGRRKGRTKKTQFGRRDANELGFELPMSSKYLLLAAYIASRNAPTLDASLFDSGEGARSGGRRKRRSGALAVEKKEAEAQKRQLRGPGSFPLERMLAIFRCIVVEHDDRYPNGLSHLLPSETSQQTEEAAAAAGGLLTEELTADVLMQVTTLVSVNLLYKNSTNPLERLTRYCCNIDSELIQKIARSVNFPLSKYLLGG